MSGPLWTREDFVTAMAGTAGKDVPGVMTGISIDSRTLQPGDAYFAIQGLVHDGHEFVGAALAAGASCAVVRDDYEGDGALVRVTDPLRALEALARAARVRSTARIAAITGSVGKTSSKEALRLALEANGLTHASEKSYNNQWGVPLSLARLPAESRFAVFEIGMNHPGEIEPLVQLVRPHVVLITTVEPVHMEFFDSEEAIAAAKAEIFTGLEAGGVAVLNRDNRHFADLAAAARRAGAGQVIGFGETAEADMRLKNCALYDDGSCVAVSCDGMDRLYRLGAPGRHLVMNSLGVLAAAAALGADDRLAAMALADTRPPKGRGARVTLMVNGGKASLIDESYNANPASMRAALALLGSARTGVGGRRIAVLGDMLELGESSRVLHEGLLGPLQQANCDLVFACGPFMQSLWTILPEGMRGGYAASSAGLEREVLAALRAGDVVMVKGSLGSRMGPLVAALKKRFKEGDSA